jgi:transposase
MKKIDMRKINQTERKILREQVIRQRELGLNNGKISENTGINAEAISRIWSAWKKEGEAGITPKKLGRPKGGKILFSVAEEEKIKKEIIEKTPESGGLWTRPKIREYIKKEFEKEIDVRRISEYCKKWGLSPQRPVKQAYKQDKKK